MRSTASKKRALAIALAATCLLAGPLYSKAFVVRSSGPARTLYPDGTLLEDNANLVLAAGSEVRLLTGVSMRTLKGPGTFNVARISLAEAGTPGSVLGGGERRARIAAVRSAGGVDRGAVARPPSIFALDLSYQKACLAGGKIPILWRADASAESVLHLKRTSDAQEMTMTWRAGQSDLPLEALGPIAVETTLSVRVDGQDSTRTMTLLPIDTAGADAADVGKKLFDAGCSNQLDLLVAALSPSEGS